MAALGWPTGPFERLRSLAAGAAAVFAVGYLLGAVAVLAAVALVGAGLLAGDGGALPLVVLLLGGGPFSAVYRWVAYGEGTGSEIGSLRDRARRTLERGWAARKGLRAGWAAAGAVAGVAPYAGPPIAVVALLAGPALVPLVVGLREATRYELDPAAGRLRVERAGDERERDLDGLVGIGALDSGGYTLLWLSYRGKGWFRGPRLVAVPADEAGPVATELRRIAAASEPDRQPTERRVALAAVAVAMLATPGTLLSVAPPEAAVVASVATAPAGILLLAVAAFR